MPARNRTIAEVIGLSEERLEGDFKIRRPLDPEESKRLHDREVMALRLTAWISAGALVLTMALSWLFLHYGRPEQAEKVVATVVGLVGGIGIGRATAPRG